MRTLKQRIHRKPLCIIVLVGCLLLMFQSFTPPALAVDDKHEWVKLPDVLHNGQSITATYKRYSVTPDGTAYFAYLVGEKLFLRKLVGDTWTFLGSSSGFSIANIDSMNFLAVAPNGTPYITVAGKVFGSASRIESLLKFNSANGSWACVIKNLNYRVDDLQISSDSRPYVLTNIGIQFIDSNGTAQTLPICTVNDNMYIRDFTISANGTPYYVEQKNIDLNTYYKVYKFVLSNGKYTKVKVGSDCSPINASDRSVAIRISPDNYAYLILCGASMHDSFIYKLSGSAWQKYSTLPDGYAFGKHFIRISADGDFYYLSIGSNQIKAYKSYETKWLEGNEVSDPGAEYSDVFLTSSNTIYTAAHSGPSCLYRYQFIPELPSFTSQRLATDQYGYTETNTLSLGNPLYIHGTLDTNEFATVKAFVYDSSEQVVAVMSMEGQLSGAKSFCWDGKATEGNTAGLTAGQYVPHTPQGLDYTVKWYAENSAGGTYSDAMQLKIAARPPTITSSYCSNFYIRPYKLLMASFYFDSDLPVTAETCVYNLEGKLVAKFNQPNQHDRVLVEWDGKATEGNEAGIPAGNLVPASEEGVMYSVSVTVTTEAGTDLLTGLPLCVIKNPPKITAISDCPDHALTLGTADDYYLTASINTISDAKAQVHIYNTDGKLVASVEYAVAQPSCTNRQFRWDGKATAGNEAGLTAGDYVPASSSGTQYTAKLYAFNEYGGQSSEPYPMNVICDPPSLASIALNPAGSFLITGTNKIDITGTISSAVPCVVEASVLDSENRVVATLQRSWQPGDAGIIAWNGRATASNEAGLPAGSIVPKGNYSIKAEIRNCAGSAETDSLAFTTDSSDTCLSELKVANGSTEYAVTPALNRTALAYTVNAPYDAAIVEISAAPEDKNATVTYTAAVNLAFGANTRSITVTAQNGSVRTYQIKIVRAAPPKPTLSAPAYTPSASSGFTPGGTNLLEVKTTVTTYAAALVELQVFNASGKLVAKVALSNQSSGEKLLAWNGKATAGNTAGLAVGSYVPVSSSGTSYLFKVVSSNYGGSVISAQSTIKLYSNPTVSSFTVYPTTFTANAAGTAKAKIGFKVNRVTNASVRVMNSAGKFVAAYSYKNLSANTVKYVYWNGMSTAGNTAGLPANSLVPPGIYSVQIYAGNTAYKPTTKITVKRTLPSISSVEFTPTAASGFTPGGTNLLSVKANLTSEVLTTVRMYVYNSAGKSVAILSKSGMPSGQFEFLWDGRATSGNTAGIPAGSVVPVSTAGTPYTIRLYARNTAGSITTAAYAIKLFYGPAISGLMLTNPSFEANGTERVTICFSLNHVSNATVTIRDSLLNIVAVYSFTNVQASVPVSVEWGGFATEGNTLGLPAGSALPAEQYKVTISAGNTAACPAETIIITVP